MGFLINLLLRNHTMTKTLALLAALGLLVAAPAFADDAATPAADAPAAGAPAAAAPADQAPATTDQAPATQN